MHPMHLAALAKLTTESCKLKRSINATLSFTSLYCGYPEFPDSCRMADVMQRDAKLLTSESRHAALFFCQESVFWG